MPKMNIFEYDTQIGQTYHYTRRDAIRLAARRVFFTVTYPLFAAIRRYHRWQRERAR